MEVIRQNQDIRNMQTLKWVCAFKDPWFFIPMALICYGNDKRGMKKWRLQMRKGNENIKKRTDLSTFLLYKFGCLRTGLLKLNRSLFE